jgi:anti-sigma factor RsiW
MSHLGHRLSALVDGELGDVERDRALTHLAGCAACQAEAAALRELKGQLQGLMETAADAALTDRLIDLAAPGDPVPPRPRLLRGTQRSQPAPYAWHAGSAWHTESAVWPGSAAGAGGAGSFGGAGSPHPAWTGPRSAWSIPVPLGSRHRTRNVIFCAVSFVALSLGATAFTIGGDQGSPGPKITPPVEMYSVEHAITTGEVPFTGPTSSAAGPTASPVASAASSAPSYLGSTPRP